MSCRCVNSMRSVGRNGSKSVSGSGVAVKQQSRAAPLNALPRRHNSGPHQHQHDHISSVSLTQRRPRMTTTEVLSSIDLDKLTISSSSIKNISHYRNTPNRRRSNSQNLLVPSAAAIDVEPTATDTSNSNGANQK